MLPFLPEPEEARAMYPNCVIYRDPDDPGHTVRLMPGIPCPLAGKQVGNIEAVFEAFFRIEGSRNRNSGGVGLGLTIAREAARRQGGDIRLEQTPGGGLTAVLCLPRQPPV